MSTQESREAPTVEHRPAQPYVGVRARVTLQTFPEIADRMPEVFKGLAQRGIAADGAPFFKYNLIDMRRELELEAGVPVAAAPDAEVLWGDLFTGELPEGRYVTYTHVGHPDGLYDATAALLTWAPHQGLRWDRERTPEGERWGCRLESYLTDPRVEPDMAKWETQLAFRLAD
jgi:effector-binding domain-containing protein